MIDGKWEYSEDNHVDERCCNGDCTGWVKSSSLFPLLCHKHWLSCWLGRFGLRGCRRAGGSVAAVG